MISYLEYSWLAIAVDESASLNRRMLASWDFMSSIIEDGDQMLSKLIVLNCDKTSSYLLPDLDAQNLSD